MSEQMKLILNDPMIPELFAMVPPIEVPEGYPPIIAQGYVGPQDQVGTSQWRSAQSYYTVINGLKAMQPTLPAPVSHWARTEQLCIIPEAGQDFNAYYDGMALRFFYAPDPVTKKVVYAADSCDVVAHEFGHSLLDCIRPDLWSMQCLEVWSFHEAFGDITAILTTMNYDEVLKMALEQTGGDLMKSNVISRLAEQLGNAIYHAVGGRNGFHEDSLREANNKFIYQIPENLPQSTPDDQLAAECHSFGRVFVGAYYEIISKIFMKENTTGDPLAALKKTRQVAAEMLTHGVCLAAASPRFYDSVARSIIAYDLRTGGKYQEELQTTFIDHRILNKKVVRAQATTKLADLDLSKHAVAQSPDGSTFVRVKNSKTIKLSDHFGVRAQANNPLYQFDIEVPCEQHLQFNASGFLTDSVATSEQMAINSARVCIKFLHDNNHVSLQKLPEGDMSKMFHVVDGKIVRNFCICGCRFDDSCYKE